VWQIPQRQTPFGASTGGGGSSHQRTRLPLFVPCFTGKYREIYQSAARDSRGSSAFRGKFNPLPSEFPSRQSRENLRAIREPEARNSEPYPNNGSRVWRHTESYNAFSPAVVGEAAGMPALELKAAIIRSAGNVAEVPITDVWLFRASEADCELLPLN
jgi:hypothetical protein